MCASAPIRNSFIEQRVKSYCEKMRRKQDFSTPCSLSQKRRPGILSRALKRSTATSKQESSLQNGASESTKLIYRLLSHEPVPEAGEAPKTLPQPEQAPVVMVVSGSDIDPRDEFRDAQKTLVVHVKRLYPDSDDSHTQSGNIEEQQPAQRAIGISESLSENDAKQAENSTSPTNCVVESSSKVWRELTFQRGAKTKKAPVARWYLESPTDQYHCLFCNEIFGAIELKAHQVAEHKYCLPEVGKSAFLKYIRKGKVPVTTALSTSARESTGACPHCTQTFCRRLDLLTHLNAVHEKQFVLFDLEFDSMDEFNQWLEIITYKYMTGYTKNRTNIAQSGAKTQMYLCRMEEKPRKTKVFKTGRRAQNRSRAQYCTAHLVVRFLKYGRLHVKGSPTHINHDVTLFSACRSLDDVPMDGLPGYAAVISATSPGIPKTTVDVCQTVFKHADAMKSLLGTCPAPANKNVVKILHSKLTSMLEPISSYKLRAVVLHDSVQEGEFVGK